MKSDERGLSELQFDRAERAVAVEPVCRVCGSPIADRYYSLNGHTLCTSCATSQDFGSAEASSQDLLRAGLFGFGAAVAGAMLYFAVLAITGYEIGLIAVAVGWGVGKAVRIGSRGIGGRKLQVLAVILTYLSIVGGTSTLILKMLFDGGAPNLLPGLLTVAVYTLLSPFLGGVSNIIGIFIICIGLYEAWKLNQRTRLTLEGPFALSQTGASA